MARPGAFAANFTTDVIDRFRSLCKEQAKQYTKILERTLESIQHRKSKGENLIGRPKTNEAKERLVLRLRDEGCSYRSIREQTGLALSTLRQIIAEQEVAA